MALIYEAHPEDGTVSVYTPDELVSVRLDESDLLTLLSIVTVHEDPSTLRDPDPTGGL